MGDMKQTTQDVAELTERVAALEKVVTIERRLRRLQETAMRALRARPAGDDDVTTLAPPGAWPDPDRTLLAPPTHSLHDPHSHSVSGTSQPIRAWHGVSGSARPARRARTLAPDEVAPLALAAGAELFEYRIDAVLGQGGFGITYLATDVNLQRLAQSTAGRVGQLIHDAGHLATYLATDQDLVDYLKGATAARQRRVDHMLASMIDVHPDVTHFYLMDTRGRIVVASDPALVGVNRGERDYFRVAAAGHAYVSGFVLGYPDRQPVVYYANPVRDEGGRVLGVVVLRIGGQSIAALLDETAAGGTVAPLMVDRDGIVLVIRDPRRRYHSLGPLSEARRARIRAERFDGERLDSLGMPDLARALAGAGSAGSLGYHSTLTDEEEIAGFAPVPGQDWTVAVSESRARFEAPLDRLFDNVLRGVALVGLLCLVCGILSARAIVGPVARLTLAADALKRGDYEGAHVPVTSSDELGRLARTFNIMIDVLRQRERERRRGRRGRKERTETRRT